MTDEELQFTAVGDCAGASANHNDGAPPAVQARARLQELATQPRDDVAWLTDPRAQAPEMTARTRMPRTQATAVVLGSTVGSVHHWVPHGGCGRALMGWSLSF